MQAENVCPRQSDQDSDEVRTTSCENLSVSSWKDWKSQLQPASMRSLSSPGIVSGRLSPLGFNLNQLLVLWHSPDQHASVLLNNSSYLFSAAFPHSLQHTLFHSILPLLL